MIASTGTAGRVDATTAAAWLRDPETTVVIDVRTPGEFAAVHITGSYNVPLDLLGEHAGQFAARLAEGPDHHVVLVCQSGARATRAGERLSGLGLPDLRVLDGGVPAFAAAGGHVTRGPGRWAMDRQVRLAAGSLVLVSTVASLAAPRARFLAGAVGAGLACSALSDTCAMARVLGLLPYNRGPRAPALEEALGQLPSPGNPDGDTHA